MIETNIESLKNELLDIVKIFYPVNYEKIDIKHAFGGEGSEYIDFFNICGIEYSIKHKIAEYYAKQSNFIVLKKIVKADLYKILSKMNKQKSLWGSLTGIRPVKLYKDTFEQYGAGTDKFFRNFFCISRKKLALIKDIAKTQHKLTPLSQNDCDLYIGIPFCNGRCSYCSFVSADINKTGGLAGLYTNALIAEITALKETIKRKNLKIRSIYIGGGTPSSFSVERLEEIFKTLKTFKPIEYTFEAGRPDSITKELLNLLSKHGIDRISINPQSANDKTLKLIGRGHTFADVLRAYSLAKKYNFIINMDIIAGLEGEAFEDFKNTLDKVVKLNPDNITVHTLCLKKGSVSKINLEKQKGRNSGLGKLKDENPQKSPFRRFNLSEIPKNIAPHYSVFKMLDYSGKILNKNRYRPYYLYRQKYSIGNLENIGYCKEGKACLYNIDNMDDTVSILACGANAISKRVYDGGRIERYANPKDIKTYIEKVQVIDLEKNKLFD